MADGVVTIPFPGQPISCANGELAAMGHFLAGPENRLVVPAVNSVLEQQSCPYNPLVIYGPSGTGKSHLAQGLAAAWKARFSGVRIVSTNATDFAREAADAFDTHAVEDMRLRYRRAGLVVVEDLAQLERKEAAQVELINLLDALLRAGHQFVATANADPADLPLLPGLRARLSAGLTLPLAPPGPKCRRAILEKLVELRQIALADSAVGMLAQFLNGTVPELMGALTQLEAPARLEGDTIGRVAVQDYIARHTKGGEPQIRHIAAATTRYFSLELADLRGPCRRRPVVTARNVAMYLGRKLTGESLQQIGQYFGGRDHTTVMHGCRKIEKLRKTDPAIEEAITEIQEKVDSRTS